MLLSSKNSTEFGMQVYEDPFQNLSQISEMQTCLNVAGAKPGSENIS